MNFRYSFLFILFYSLVYLASAAPLPETSFDVDKPLLYATVSYGETTDVSFTLLNHGKLAHFSLSPSYNKNFFSMDVRSLDLEEGGSASVRLVLGAATLAPGVYVGSVSIVSEVGSTEVPVVLEVQRSPLLFDATIRELPHYSELRAGEQFAPQIIVYNLRSLDSTVTLLASVYSLSGERVSRVSQVLEVTNTLETSISLPLPSSLPDGPYILGLELVAGSSYGTATTSLRVGSPSLSPSIPPKNKSFLYSLIVIAFLLASFIVLNYLWRRHLISSTRYWDEQVQQARLVGPSLKARKKLAYQQQLLSEAYAKGYISKSAYQTTRTRIDRARRALKKRL